MEILKDNTDESINIDTPNEHSEDIFPECRFCEKMQSENLPPKELYRLFHENCAACPDEDWILCDACRHARLTHIFLCPETGDDVVLHPIPMPHIKGRILGQTASDCAFCSFVASVAEEGPSGSSLEDCSIIDIEIDIFSLDIRSTQTYDRARQLRINFRGEGQQNDWDVGVGLGVKSSCMQSQRPAKELRHPTIDQNPALETMSTIMGGALSRPSRATVNWDAVSALIAVCCEEHPDCHSKALKLPSDFRVIDVERRCIIEPKETIKYCALSYVWGEAGKIEQQKPEKLTKSLLEQFKRRDSLSPSELPRTIEDAIQACLALRIQYLWVDRFCIVQDDECDKANHISAMGDIFASAYLAIIAAEAGDMNSGISGISNPREAAQWTLSSSISDLVQLSPSLSSAIMSCRWSSRAWTYQEAVLSRKKLWLTSAEVHFQCCKGVFAEGFFVDTNSSSTDEFQLLWTDGLPTANVYFLLLAQYTERSLTYNSDIYNAFTGIANTLYKMDALVYGLPRVDFDQALLWQAWGFEIFKTRISEAVLLPSWSWASVQGEGIGHLPHTREFCGSLVHWVVCMESEGRVAVEPIKADNTPNVWEKEQKGNAPLYMALACIEDCFLSTTSTTKTELLSCRNGTFKEIGLFADTLWPTYKTFCQDLCSGQYRTCWPHSIKKAPGTLLGHTQTAMLRVSTESDNSSNHLGFGICDDHGRRVGALRLTEPLWEVLKGSMVKVIALSVSRLNSDYPAMLYSGYVEPYCDNLREERDWAERQLATEKTLQDKNENLTFFDCEGAPLLPPPLVELMVVEKRGECHRRVCLGWAFLSRWVDVKRRFESVALV